MLSWKDNGHWNSNSNSNSDFVTHSVNAQSLLISALRKLDQWNADLLDLFNKTPMTMVSVHYFILEICLGFHSL